MRAVNSGRLLLPVGAPKQIYRRSQVATRSARGDSCCVCRRQKRAGDATLVQGDAGCRAAPQAPRGLGANLLLTTALEAHFKTRRSDPKVVATPLEQPAPSALAQGGSHTSYAAVANASQPHGGCHAVRASAWPSDPAEQAAFLHDLGHSDWNVLSPQVAATIFFQGALAMTSVFDTRFGPRVYWLRPLVHGEVAVAREAPTGVLFVDASLQALRSTIGHLPLRLVRALPGNCLHPPDPETAHSGSFGRAGS